jgi:hypothetical protein
MASVRRQITACRRDKCGDYADNKRIMAKLPTLIAAVLYAGPCHCPRPPLFETHIPADGRAVRLAVVLPLRQSTSAAGFCTQYSSYLYKPRQPSLVPTVRDEEADERASRKPSWAGRHGGGGMAPAGTMRAHRCGKTPYTMRSVEMRKRRSGTLPKSCSTAEDALPYSTLE